MAITTNAICDSFKKQLLGGEHDFDSSGGDTYKLAMYTSSATLGKSTANYITAIKYQTQVLMQQVVEHLLIKVLKFHHQ